MFWGFFVEVVRSVQSVFGREQLLKGLCSLRFCAWFCVGSEEVCVGEVEDTGQVVAVEHVGNVGGLIVEGYLT